MKKILILMLCMVFLVGVVNAANWDNKLSYSNNDLKVDFSNSFLLLFETSEIGSAELKSHSSVEQVRHVGAGSQVVMWYDFDFLGLYENGLGDVEFTDIRTGGTIERDYSFVYWGEENYEAPTYSERMLKNGTILYEQTGTETKTREAWLIYDSKDIPRGNIRIGLRTYVEINDKVDGVWTIAGKRVKKHAGWTANLDTDLISYYKMDETSGTTAEDSHGSNDGTASTEDIFTSSVEGIINTGADFGSKSDSRYVDVGDIGVTDTISVSAWVNMTSDPNGDNSMVLCGPNPGGLGLYIVGYNTGERKYKLSFGKIGVGEQLSTDKISPNLLQHVVWVYNSTHIRFFINGSEDSGGPIAYDIDTSETSWYIGAGVGGSNYFNGHIDEVPVWSRELTPAEVTQLYNSGAGITYEDIPPSTGLYVNLDAPANDVTIYQPTMDFNCTAFDDSGITNVSLVVNGSVVDTNSSGYNNTLVNFNYNLGSSGFYNWTCWAYDDEDNLNNSAEVRNITYSNDLSITLNAPEIMANISTIPFGLNGTASDDTAVVNVSLIINATYNGTDTSGTNNTLYNFDRSLADGFYNWTMEVCDAVSCQNATAWNFTIDTIPPEINITYPTNTTYTDDYTNTSSTSININFTQSDSHLDTCMFYNLSSSTNKTIACGNNVTYPALDYGTYTQYYYVNDTFGHLTQDNVTFTLDYGVLENDVDYTPFTYETDNENFVLNFTTTKSVLSVAGTMTYNGTEYSSTSEGGGNTYTLTNNLAVPLVTEGVSSENRTFYWNFTIYTGTGSYDYNTTTYEQNVSEILLEVGGTNPAALNFTAYNEENISRILNYDFYGTFDYWLGDGSIAKEFSVSNASINETVIRISPNETYYVDAQIQYEKEDYIKRTYYMNNHSIDNSTENINLLLLLEDSSTSFIIKVIDEVQMPVENVYVNIQRFYAGEDSFRTVEMGLTDSSGKTVGHLEEETEDYRFIITQDGETLYTSEARKIYCEDTPCSITLQIGESETTEWEDYGEVDDDFEWDLDYDESSNTWTYTYVDESGDASQGRLLVYLSEGDGKTTICNTTSPNPSATITCDTTGYNGTIFAEAFVTRGTEILVYVKSVIVRAIKDIIGNEGLIFAMFILLMLGLIGLWNPAVGIILVAAGFIFINFIGLASFGAVTIAGILVIGIILIWLLKT